MLWTRHTLTRLNSAELRKRSVRRLIAPDTLAWREHRIAAITFFIVAIVLVTMGNLSYSERLPDTAELFADGPHHATEAYEIGNPNLETETARGVEIIVRKTAGKVTGQFSAFHTRFNNYVFLEPHAKCGEIRLQPFLLARGLEILCAYLLMRSVRKEYNTRSTREAPPF